MKPDVSHIKQIKVISNTHWDREFRWSWEKTRRRLLTMLDVTLDILEKDPKYHSFTMDGHSIMIDDYLEMRPEKRPLVEKLVKEGRLVLGPYYTLAEEFSISHEALVRNLMFGRKTVAKYGGKTGTVAYTPSSWGQTGQMPQILADFGLNKAHFYRGVAPHEVDAEWIWAAPDGTRILASRFAIFVRYNWYYFVHRPVSVGQVLEKDYTWGAHDEALFRFADGLAGEDLGFSVLDPQAHYDKTRLKEAIENMVETEGRHFTTDVFIGMNGHDISVAFPHESKVIADANEIFKGKYTIEHTNLEETWKAMEKQLDPSKMTVLTGERRAYLRTGKWTFTFLFPNTISARTYLKLADFSAYTKLAYYAEPLASLAAFLGDKVQALYLERGWQFLISNHTHDANGGCAPDPVCQDMEYRYRQASEIGDIVSEDAMAYVAKNLSPEGLAPDVMQLVVYNPLPMTRDAVVAVDVEIPKSLNARGILLDAAEDKAVEQQPISSEKSGSFVNGIWDVPVILDSIRMKSYALFRDLPGLGYRAYKISASSEVLRPPKTLKTGPSSMENEHLKVEVNPNGTVNLVCKATGREYRGLNYLTDQGEWGNAWKHAALRHDSTFNSLGVKANVAFTESGPLVAVIEAGYNFAVPLDGADGIRRSEVLADLPVKMEYRLEKGARELRVRMTVDNRAKDHWLRANFPTGLKTDETAADSHFDVVTRPIPLPDSTGWTEAVGGTHPLRTFVSLSDKKDGLAVMTKGLYEYEAYEDEARTLGLTVIRACRIKLAVSEEKLMELPDVGVQCPGTRAFEYALSVHQGGWQEAGLISRAAAFYVPARAAMTSRGKGRLPLQAGLLSVDNANLHVTAVKPAEDASGLVVRLFNPAETKAKAFLTFGGDITRAARCKMDESETEALKPSGAKLALEIGPKKIVTVKVVLKAF